MTAIRGAYPVLITPMTQEQEIDWGGVKNNVNYFVDQGVELPFFLKRWKHKHRVISSGTGSVIRDEIEFEAPFWLMNYILFPVLWLQFSYRKPIYRRIFKRSASQ